MPEPIAIVDNPSSPTNNPNRWNQKSITFTGDEREAVRVAMDVYADQLQAALDDGIPDPLMKAHAERAVAALRDVYEGTADCTAIRVIKD